ncbi:MAG: hypothetical protein ACYCUG_15095 [Acidimicrobiales bacterium]
MGVVVNRVLPELFSRSEEALFERIGQPEATAVLDGELGASSGPLLGAARLMVTTRRSRTEHLERLRAGVDPRVPLLYVPYLFIRSHGLRATHQVADALSAELGY